MRSRRGRGISALLVGLCITIACGEARPPDAGPRHIVDRHVHILGPDVLQDWKSLGVPFSRPDSLYLSPAALLNARRDAKLDVVLVPMAHLYGDSEFVGALRLSDDSARARLRRENAHVAREAQRFVGRAVAYCSVPVRAAWALAELNWCADTLATAGVKLHLASSGVHFKRPDDVARVAAIAAWTEARGLPMLLHVDTQRDSLDAADVRLFADRVLAPLPRLVVTIAHLGGSGGYGARTRMIFRTLQEWERVQYARGDTARRLCFDISAVVLDRESEGVPATTPTEARALREDLRRVGLHNIVLGSDYPVFDPVRTLELLRSRVGLTADEVAQVAAPRAHCGA